jgi:hypothetical protein
VQMGAGWGVKSLNKNEPIKKMGSKQTEEEE